MIHKQFKATWPHVCECLKEIALDNNMRMTALVAISDDLATELNIVEKLAAILSDGQKEVFCTDEETIVLAMVEVYNLQPLHEFLNHAFDGVLNSVFYE